RFLPSPGTPLRAAVLHELIKTDMEVRCRRGLAFALEDYATRFPELGPAAALPARLIYEEYRVRTLFGDRPPLVGYRDRFPHRFDELRKLLAEQPLPAPTNPTSPGTGQPARPASLPPAEVLPPSEGYTLFERIGTGQYGEVFRARTPGGVDVA